MFTEQMYENIGCPTEWELCRHDKFQEPFWAVCADQGNTCKPVHVVSSGR